jgi:hypothetical protein
MRLLERIDVAQIESAQLDLVKSSEIPACNAFGYLCRI